MKIVVQFKQYNEDFSQDYANEYCLGKEDVGNEKFKWGSGIEVPDVESIKFKEGEQRNFLKDGTKDIPVSNITVLECKLIDGSIIEFGASKNILEAFHEVQKGKHKKHYVYFYLKAESEFMFIAGRYCISREDL